MRALRVFSLTLIGLLGGVGIARAQSTPPPDCVINFNFTATGVTPSFNNTVIACQTWTVDYQASSTGTISSLSLVFQSANGTLTAGTFGTYAGTKNTGANPATNTTGEVSTFSNATQIISWVRMSLTLSATGTTNVNGVLYGYKTGYSGSGGGGGGGGCTAPCVVIGPVAPGSAPTQDPVLVGSQDFSGNTENIRSDVNGSLLPGAYPTIAAIALTTSGLTVLVTHTSSDTTTVSHYSISFASSVSFQLEYGTGSACGTGTTALTGVYQPLTSIAIDTPFIVPAGKDLCANLGASVVGGGAIVYSQP